MVFRWVWHRVPKGVTVAVYVGSARLAGRLFFKPDEWDELHGAIDGTPQLVFVHDVEQEAAVRQRTEGR